MCCCVWRAEVASRDSPLQMETISDPSVTHIELEALDPSSHYVFKVIAYTAAGEGPPITRRGATLLDGGTTTAAGLQYLPVQHLYVLTVVSHVFIFSSTHLSSVCTVPPSNITIVPGNTSFNLSWVPGERDRNHGFHFEYLKKSRKMHKFSAGELLKRIGVM